VICIASVKISNKISKFHTSVWLLSAVHDGTRLQPYHEV